MGTIRLAIVDDSTFVRRAIERVLLYERRIKIIGMASCGEELLENLNLWRPDAVTLDLEMPGMGGIATLDRIMEWKRIPVIILSTHSAKNAPLTLEALHRGAVDFIDKQQYSLVDFDALRGVLTRKIIRVVQGEESVSEIDRPKRSELPAELGRAPAGTSAPFDALVIGASTGGPPAVQKVLEDLGSSLTVPVAIVQHMPPGFTSAFADRLNLHLPFTVKEPSQGEPFLPGTVYIAPTGLHMSFSHAENGICVELSKEPKELTHRPSVDVLFRSAAKTFGSRIVGVIMTGMGRDGAEGMVELADAGAVTIGQNRASCVVYGMPKVAREWGAVKEELSLIRLGSRVRQLLCTMGSDLER